MSLPILGANTLSAAGFNVANSCQFDGSSDYLHRTLGTPTNNKIWTFSCWFKVCQIGEYDQYFFNTYETGYSRLYIKSSNSTLAFDGEDDGNGNGFNLNTNMVFRDIGSWYHICVAWDVTQSTASNRCKIYINGTQITSWATETYPGQNVTNYTFNSAVKHWLGRYKFGSDGTGSYWWDGYFAEFVFIDGSALAPTSFGEFNSSTPNTFQPIDVSGLTFGNNGFYLNFADSGDLGDDESGNTNDCTEVGLAAANQCIDSPTNNLATLNKLHMSDPSSNFFVDNGNNTLEATNNDVDRLTGATIHPQGIKGYFEFKALTDNNWRCALQEDGVAMTKNNYTALSSGQFYGLDSSGNLAYANGGSSTYHIQYYISGSTANGDIIGCAFDFTGSNRNVWFHKNGTYGNNGSGTGVPSTGAYPGLTSTQLSTTKEFEFLFMCNTGGSSSSIGLNFGNGNFDGTAISSAGTNASFGSFEYDVPSGFGPICTKTLNGTYS